MHVFYIVTLKILMGNQQICLCFFHYHSCIPLVHFKQKQGMNCTTAIRERQEDSGNGATSPLNCKNGCQREYQKQILIIYYDYCRNVIHLEHDIKPSPKSILVHLYKISCYLQHGLCILLFHLLCSCDLALQIVKEKPFTS